MLKICPICKTEFNKRKEQITCSKRCAAIWRSKIMKGLKHKHFNKKLKNCPICKKLFVPKRKERKTCSVECGHKLQGMKVEGSNNGLYNENLPIHICKECGKKFRPITTQINRGFGKFCSVKCSNKNKIVEEVPYICEECGKIKYAKPARALKMQYCSRSCYLKNCNKRSYKVDYMVSVLKNLGYKVEEEKSFCWLKTIRGHHLFLDLFLPDQSIAIEYDGQHHYKLSLGYDTWGDVKYRQKLDKLKDSLCESNGINMIRFKYDENLSQEYILYKLGVVV